MKHTQRPFEMKIKFDGTPLVDSKHMNFDEVDEAFQEVRKKFGERR